MDRSLATPLAAFRPLAQWLFVAAVLAVSVIGAIAINSLGTRGDRYRRLETTLAQLEQRAHELNALEWESIHKGTLVLDLEKEVINARQEMQELFHVLTERDLKLSELDAVTRRYQVYSKLLTQEFMLLAAGQVHEAEELDETKVDPAFDQLSDSLKTASLKLDRLASTVLQRARIWTFAILFSAAAVVGILFWQYHHRRRVSAVAAAEQRVLRQANSQLEQRVEERTAELALLNQQISISARKAGMAEVANSVLHNVGNALNSVNVSASLVLETLAQSRLIDLPAAAGLLQEHALDLGAFLTQDEQGRQFPGFLCALAGQWETEHFVLTREATALNKNIRHVREIVQRQQAIAGVSGMIENVAIAPVIEDALALNAPLLAEKAVQICQQIDPDSSASADRSKLTQILVNLIRNAAQALAESDAKPRQVTLRTEAEANGRTLIHIRDNGKGISAEDSTRMFSYGFTTKTNGHGFGLHASAIGAKEMGGTLRVQSDGPGLGATFTLELPAPVAVPMREQV